MIDNDIVTKYILNRKQKDKLLIIGIGGNIASGKSTFARVLKKRLLSEWNDEKIEILSTDDFLYSNDYLHHLNLFHQKGWPNTYDQKKIDTFFSALSVSRSANLTSEYSQMIGDLTICSRKIEKPTIIIVEGTMVFTELFSKFIDIFCYLDVDLSINFDWYLKRALSTLTTKKEYRHLKSHSATSIIKSIWEKTNMVSFKKCILPYKNIADFRITLNEFHEIETIYENKKILSVS